MDIKKRLAVLASVTAVVATVYGASASEVKLEYVEFATDTETARKYWSDEEITMADRAVSGIQTVIVANFRRGDEVLTATMLASPSVCGMNTCPLRIYAGNELIEDLNVCSNSTMHSSSPSGRYFAACDDVFTVGR